MVGSALVIAGGCPGWPRSGELLLRQRPFQFVGQHLVLVVPHALAVPDRAADGAQPQPDRARQAGTCSVGSFVLAVAMYFIVEQPIRSRNILARRPTLGLAMGAVFVTASVRVALVTAPTTQPCPRWPAAAARSSARRDTNRDRGSR